MPSLPTFDYEQMYWQQGLVVAGIDEVGIGALAGPVVAAAVVFQPHRAARVGKELEEVNDSKKLSARRREQLAPLIKSHCLAWAVGESPIQEITRLNVLRAAHLAMRRAVQRLPTLPDVLLVDGQEASLGLSILTVDIVSGDQLSFSIAAASILAKVHRDQIMKDLDRQFPNYGFGQHKGYGTKKHLETLRQYGSCLYHRPTYRPVRSLTEKSSDPNVPS